LATACSEHGVDNAVPGGPRFEDIHLLRRTPGKADMFYARYDRATSTLIEVPFPAREMERQRWPDFGAPPAAAKAPATTTGTATNARFAGRPSSCSPSPSMSCLTSLLRRCFRRGPLDDDGMDED
jgi:hypothetical protein